VCLAVLGSAAVVGGCRPGDRGGGPDIGQDDIQIELGPVGLVRDEAWSVLRLRLRNRGDDFRGEVVAEGRGQQPGDTVTYRQELEVPGRSATWREVSLPVQCWKWTEVTITLRQPGYARSFVQGLPKPASSDALCLLAVGDATPNLSSLVRHVEEGVARGLPDGIQPRPVRAVSVEPQRLSPQALDLEAFQLVLLLGPDLSAAPGGAVEALAAWVERGGTIVAFPGPSWPGSSGAALERLLGARIGPAGETPPVALQESLDPSLRRFSYRLVRAVDAARADEDALSCRARVGLGLAHTFRLSPNEVTADLFSAPPLLNALQPVLERAVSFAGDAGTGLRQIEKHVLPALAAQCGRRLPSRGIVGLSLTLYGLLGFVLPWRLLGRRGRRELAFLVMVGASLAAIGCIYGLGVFSSLPAIEVEEVTVVRALPGEDRAQATSFLGVISPRPRRVDLAGEAREALRAGGRRVLWRPLRGQKLEYFGEGEPLPVPATSIASRLDGTAEVEPFGLFPNALRLLRCDFETSLASGIRIETADAGGEPHFTVVNDGDRRAAIHLIRGATHREVGTVEPGARLELRLEHGSGPSDVPLDAIRRAPWLRADPGSRDGPLDTFLPLLLRRVTEPSRILPGRNQWTIGPDGQPVAQPEELEALRNPWAAYDPRQLVAITAAPTFPALQSIPRRQALTAVVFELPPARGNRE
jgi:hypothetical protein